VATSYGWAAGAAWLIAVPCAVATVNILLDIDRARPLPVGRVALLVVAAVWVAVATRLAANAARHLRSRRFR